MKDLTIRYSDAELEEFRLHIDTKIREAETEIEKTQRQIKDLNENGFNQQGGDWYDDTSNHVDMEMLERMLARQVDLVKLLRNALLRIQNKTYGICFVTHKLIDKRRLLLVPHTTKSVEGKSIKNVQSNPNQALNSVQRLHNETAEKLPRPQMPLHTRGHGSFAKDTSDWNGPSAESIEDASYTQKFDVDE